MPATPIHTLNLYAKPKISTAFIRQLPVYNYKHSINAIGGFDTASFDIALRSEIEMQQFLDQYLANRMAIYVDNPVEPIFEGLVSRLSFTAGGVKYSISLEQMANRVRCIYSSAAGGAPPQTAVNNDTNSQAIYGIKQEQVDLGYMGNASGVTLLRDTILAQRAYPKSSNLPNNANDSLMHVDCQGFFHTLEWEDYRQASAANAQLGNLVDTVLGAVVNGTTFFDSGDTSLTIANTNVIDQQQITGETKWQVMMKIVEQGDASNFYVIGITPTDLRLGTRRFYYQTANTNIVYTARQADGLRIRNLNGQLVDPWRVRPDAGIRVSDMLIGWSGVGSNPTETYIKKIDYDANQQTCVYSGDDDTTDEGIFNLKRFNNAQGKRFGAARRL